jgi:hypothetical protein
MLVLALHTGAARADDFSTEQPGSILIFPKVVSLNKSDPEGPQHDTLIQITNTSNMPLTAHCYYVDGSPRNPFLPPHPVDNPPQCRVVDFEISLTRQQPTSWSVSSGRAVNPTDSQAGLDPGLVPPMRSGFTGELICVEVEDSGFPLGANALKGEATIGDVRSGDVTRYNAMAIEAIEPMADLDLELDGVEYAACPEALLVNVQQEGGSDPGLDGLGSQDSVVNTNLTLVPCSVDLENLNLHSVTMQFEIHNEFEQETSTSTAITCWQSLSLAEISGAGNLFGELGSSYGTVRLVRSDGDVGMIGIGTTRRIDLGTGATGTSSYNLHVEGNNPSTNTGAVIRIRNL